MARHTSVVRTVHCLYGLGQRTDTHLGSRIIPQIFEKVKEWLGSNLIPALCVCGFGATY